MDLSLGSIKTPCEFKNTGEGLSEREKGRKTRCDTGGSKNTTPFKTSAIRPDHFHNNTSGEGSFGKSSGKKSVGGW